MLVGLGLSIAAMIVAAFGYLPPVAGAFTQELIDRSGKNGGGKNLRLNEAFSGKGTR